MSKPTRFGLIGAAGFVAPRHMGAMKETGGVLDAAVDPNDSVGVIDSYFPQAAFFTCFEEFDDFIDKRRRAGAGLDYVSICSPNHLHEMHARAALRAEADAICEKPLTLVPEAIDHLAELERDTGRRVSTILQLRLHPAIQALREKIRSGPPDRVHDVDLTYITSRGRWYHASWKGDEEKSGGIATNIGVHFYDMLGFLFGDLRENLVSHRAPDHAAGRLTYDRARVRWFLSINAEHLPKSAGDGQRTYRSITIDGDEIEFSGGFTDLHTASYAEILAGRGFGLDDVRPSIETVAHIRTAPLETGLEPHPLLPAERAVAAPARRVPERA